MRIIDKLKMYLDEKNISQDDAAKQIGIGRATISRLLNGVVTKNSILMVEDFLEEQNYHPEENLSKRLTQDDASADMPV